MSDTLQKTVALLARTPATLNALLRDLPEDWTLSNEGGATWSPRSVVGHLISGERTDWIPRARMIVQFGESKTFEPFDREGYVRETRDKSLPVLLDEFARVRSENLLELRAWKLQPADLERRGMHPSLGGVTLAQLLATWVVHDLDHLHQISRTLAHQYSDAVGPWIQYLGVLRCSAHGS